MLFFNYILYFCQILDIQAHKIRIFVKKWMNPVYFFLFQTCKMVKKQKKQIFG